MTATPRAEPACPGFDARARSLAPGTGGLRAVARPFDSISPEAWDRLAAANPWATPFARWAFHRAWWDAYGASAHEQTLVLVPAGDPDDADPVAIAPFMHRHEVEPGDEDLRTHIRGPLRGELTHVEPTAKAIFFGASYHADYATILARPEDLPAVADAVVDHLAEPPSGEQRWDVVDLRRLRCGDPAADALAAAFGAREMGEGWTLNVEREDVCPVVTLPEGGSFDDYLATLNKKSRHEIRRKLRRAEAAGDVRLVDSEDPVADLEAFIDLHQKRWGELGLFPDNAGGAASRVCFRRLFQLLGPDGTVGLTFLVVGDRRIAAGVHMQTPDSFLYYNAGVDPDARDLSPGVVMVARYLERALAEGRHRFDFLRGDEGYKYEWGAVDEPIQRILVRRSAAQQAAA